MWDTGLARAFALDDPSSRGDAAKAETGLEVLELLHNGRTGAGGAGAGWLAGVGIRRG